LKSESVLTGTDRIERRLLLLAAAFMFFYALALSLSPAAWTRSWQVSYRWDHWLGFAVWSGMFALAHAQGRRLLPGRDPYLLPVGALLSGWGLLSVWRLLPEFGARQTAWLLIGSGLLIAGMRLHGDLAFLRRYKYLWLSGALLLTAATLLFGVNPLGYGPPMWLGCCGVYLQPSEPLKLLLIAYLAAYMAGRQPFLVLANAPFPSRPRTMAALLPLLAPTLVMTGLALVILVVQRDLGTATVFFVLYASVVYLSSGKRRVLLAASVGLFAAGLLGYLLFDVVRLRVEAWLNPWLDPSGRSYQIVQSLISVANGGLIGRGPGMGSPWLVPLAHSDLIFSAIAEEMGLAGVVGMLLLFALISMRGLRAALYARGHYHRYLAAGVTALIAGQGLLIIAGSLRLLPLTGVTLPFVSYGGSSLVTQFVCLLLLIQVSDRGEKSPAPLYRPGPYLYLGGLLLAGFTACALIAGWWALPRGDILVGRTDNQRRAISDRYVLRGAILDRKNTPINESVGQTGELERRTLYPPLSNVVGYTNPTYGQAGLEASMDDYLRGLRGNPGLTIWLDHLVYGQPPPGLDVRLTIDLDLQRQVDDLLKGHTGAAVVLDAASGEVLAMASQPGFDANQLEQEWEKLVNDAASPLLNRAVLGRYPTDDLEQLFPAGFTPLKPNPAPALGLEQPAIDAGQAPDSYSPLQMAQAAAAISSGGLRPAPQIVAAVNTPLGGWVPLEPLSEPAQAFEPALASQIAARNVDPEQPIWGKTTVIDPATSEAVTWFIGGTIPGESESPYAIAVVLEEQDQELAEQIGIDTLMSLLKFPQ
jgi:cell division protein FtsW (lipid II flippase)